MTVAADPNALHGFSKPQVEKAASALLAHLRKNSGGKGKGGDGKSNDLFEDDDELLYMVRSFEWRSLSCSFCLLSVEKMLLVKSHSCAQRRCEQRKTEERGETAASNASTLKATAASFFFFVSTATALPSNALVSFSRAHSLSLLSSLSLSLPLAIDKSSQIVSLKKVPQERRNDKPVRMYVEFLLFFFFFRFPMPPSPPPTARLAPTST